MSTPAPAQAIPSFALKVGGHNVYPLRNAAEVEDSAKWLERDILERRIAPSLALAAAENLVKAASADATLADNPHIARWDRIADYDEADKFIACRAWPQEDRDLVRGALKTARQNPALVPELMDRVAQLDELHGVDYARTGDPDPVRLVLGGPTTRELTKLASTCVLVHPDMVVPAEALAARAGHVRHEADLRYGTEVAVQLEAMCKQAGQDCPAASRAFAELDLALREEICGWLAHGE